MGNEQRWIPITDYFPKEEGNYFVIRQGFGHNWYAVAQFAKDAREFDEYNFRGNWKNVWIEYSSEVGYYECTSVTHWMKPPEMPITI